MDLKEEDLCYYYCDQLYTGGSLSYLVSFSITVINMVIKTICSVLIRKVGYHTKSEETTAIMSTVLHATYFSSAYLLLF